MKKTLLIATLAVSLSGLSAFGQGYFNFSGAVRGAWDLFTPANGGTPKFGGTTVNVGFVWGTGPALITSIAASTVTNNLAANSAALTGIGGAWNAILNDPNFKVAVDNNTGLQVARVVASNGSWAYTTTGGFAATPVTNTVAQSYSVYAIGWDSTYATPALAGAAGAAVGWGSVFTYAAVSNIGTPLTMTASGMPIGFGVLPVPEPATFALAGLGMAAMLVSRRRK